jgi:two-component system chemotaxis response regulator CheB
VIVIGCSTGGGLYQILPSFPPDIDTALAIVQHMPEGAIEVREATLGDRLERGVALVAPAGSHLAFSLTGRVILNQEPRSAGFRPSINVTLRSAARSFGPAMIAVLLTGMGYDGLEGAAHVKNAGGIVLAEHESSCVVYGMPRQVIEAGLADMVVPLSLMSRALLRLASSPLRRRLARV